MLRAIGWLIKASAFALVVIVLANHFKIGKRTVSDQIQLELSHAESAPAVKDIQGWALGETKAVNGVKRKRRPLRRVLFHKHRPIKVVNEEIPSSERQKLRALMRELNGSRGSR